MENLNGKLRRFLKRGLLAVGRRSNTSCAGRDIRQLMTHGLTPRTSTLWSY